MSTTQALPVDAITPHIATVRGQRVVIDADLAALYGVETKRFNEAVKRNLAKFSADFMFALTQEEWASLRSQFATLNAGRGRHRKYLPYAFTEHGAPMAATILNSPRAVDVAIYVVRAFVRLRELAATHGDLAQRLADLEAKTGALAVSHDTFSRDTSAHLKQVFEVLRAPMAPPDAPKLPIGFITPKDGGKKPADQRACAALSARACR